jgi:hypothetical protein
MSWSIPEIGNLSEVLARSDKYDSVKLEPMRESDPALGVGQELRHHAQDSVLRGDL